MQELQPGPALIGRTRDAFLAALRVRYSSPLFRLPTAAAIQQQLRFHNTGIDQVRSGMRTGISQVTNTSATKSGTSAAIFS